MIGHSTGGLIGVSLAARHPDRFGHIAIAGRGRETGATFARPLLPDTRVPGLATQLGTFTLRAGLASASAEDLLLSAEAMHAVDPTEVLPTVPVPILLVGGNRDVWFTTQDCHDPGYSSVRSGGGLLLTSRTTRPPTSVRHSGHVRST